MDKFDFKIHCEEFPWTPSGDTPGEAVPVVVATRYCGACGHKLMTGGLGENYCGACEAFRCETDILITIETEDEVAAEVGVDLRTYNETMAAIHYPY